MKLSILPAIAASLLFLSSCQTPNIVEISRADMADKVKGAWAGKMIGVMYGRPMEFQETDSIFTDSIAWQPEFVASALNEDDIYGQMNFMKTMELYGQDVPTDSLAKRFANAEFLLCHANLQARKNYFDSIPVVALAAPENSIHCEDIDFQIECDFIGFINPCMPQQSNLMCERIGSIMAAGDGLYAGMFVSAMHTLAYSTDNISAIVNNALKAIPDSCNYAACIRDVIAAHDENPDDWTLAWKRLNEKWAPNDICTPYHSFNIDAKLNGAYVVTGLLYGNGDWYRTMEITVRCGQDTDCNTATAAAVLGIINGYDAIPDNLKSHIPAIADQNFVYTDYSFNKAVAQTLQFIDENVTRNGGQLTDDGYLIHAQQPQSPKWKPAFGQLHMDRQITMADTDMWRFTGSWDDFVYGDGDDCPYKVATRPGDSVEIDFDGTGIAILGSWNTDGGRARATIDNQITKTFDTYYVTEAGKYLGNRSYLVYFTDLPAGTHTLRIENLPDSNPRSSANKIYIERALIYR